MFLGIAWLSVFELETRELRRGQGNIQRIFAADLGVGLGRGVAG